MSYDDVLHSDDYKEVDLSKVDPKFGCLKADPARRELYTSRYPILRLFDEMNLKKTTLKVVKRILDVPPPIRLQVMNSCVLETVCTLAAMLNTPAGAYETPHGGKSTREVMVYNSIEAYTRARLNDLDPRTDPPADIGTFPWAGFEIARTGGLSRMIRPGVWEDPDSRDGFLSYYWCTNLDDLLKVFKLEDSRLGVGLALEWYRSYSTPTPDENGEYVIDNASGPIDGGHMVTGRGFVDEESTNGIYFRNSWGKYYPGRVRLTFEQMEYQFSRGVEVVVPVDNPWRT